MNISQRIEELKEMIAKLDTVITDGKGLAEQAFIAVRKDFQQELEQLIQEECK